MDWIIAVACIFFGHNLVYKLEVLQQHHESNASQTRFEHCKMNHSNQFRAAINPLVLALKKQQLGRTIPAYWILWTVKGFQ
jgi:hypothetical protein